MLEPGDLANRFFNNLQIRNVSAGDVIFRVGEDGSVMYTLIKGQVDLMVNDQRVETILEHDVFGQGALVQPDHKRASTAIARTDCQVAELDRDKFVFLIQETPLFALEVIRSLSTRLRKIKGEV
ncbi:cyclic nucleotide-binding domain-containing protein [Cyanobacterium stanieri LEGE 03274]|uniref:Cyclic nucleotide-binding domain-containing protein n=1 Tax=Cyanobacterium stanieri LEGE 03274 TaxID=1828756 RepID=A0ABR9V7T6_9CHRO|nr:cyclic nucleotide-binding domain-containing protein [Cyanobacterium stanieri]MBE9222889.1 cyclic nucleotide-binding domain-containing protein [Cyanobacterium stanieri LEGE 03274]